MDINRRSTHYTPGTGPGAGVTGENSENTGAYSPAEVMDVGWGRERQGHCQKRVVPWADLPKVSRHLGPQPAAIPLEREEEREFSKPDARPFLCDRDPAPSHPSTAAFSVAPSLVLWLTSQHFAHILSLSLSHLIFSDPLPLFDLL